MGMQVSSLQSLASNLQSPKNLGSRLLSPYLIGVEAWLLILGS